MRLDRDSRIVKWAYMPEPADRPIPHQTSLCALFWRCVLNTPLFLLAAGLVIVLLSPVLGVLWIASKVHKKTSVSELFSDSSDWALVKGAVAMKSRVCPIVTLESSPADDVDAMA